MNLLYGLHYDRDFSLALIYSIKWVITATNLITLYPACFYLLLIEGPAMRSAIRAAYLAYFVVHMLFDVIYNLLLRVFPVPPYGLFYCEGLLCTVGLGKPVVMATITSMIIMCIPTYVFLTIRMHHMVVMESASRWKFSATSQFVFMIALILMLIGNVFGFVFYTKDVPNYESLVTAPELSWIEARGGTLILFGEPGKKSLFMNEVILFGASFSVFLPPVVFLTAHAMHLLHSNSLNATSTKTQRLTRRLFTVFRVQLRSALLFFVLPLFLDMSGVFFDLRHIFPAPLFAFSRFGAVMLFTINPAQFALIFILRNETHRRILGRKLRRVLRAMGLPDSWIMQMAISNTTTTTTETSSFRLQ